MTDTVSRRNGAARSTAFAALATAAMLPLLATGAAAQSWDEVVAAAMEEGHVTIYTGTSHPIIEQEIEAFSAKYPSITFDILDGEGPDLNSRIDQEIASGTPIVDMYISTDSQWITDANGRGIIAPLIGPAAQDFPQEFRNGDSYKIALIAGGIVVNTDLVTRPITGYEDLLGDDLAGGRLGVQRWSNNVAPAFYKHLEDNHPGFLDQIAEQQPTIYRSSEAAASGVASGEMAAALFAVPAVPKNLIAQGAPIDWIIPDDPYGLAILINVFADAPNPNAAQLFADFLLSEEGQQIWNPEGSGQASPLGFGDFEPSAIKLWAPSEWSEEEVAEQRELWERRFGG